MCLTDGVLRAYFDGELPAAERTQVAEHVTACEQCRQLAETIEGCRARVTAIFQEAAPAACTTAPVALTRFHARIAEAERSSQRRFEWKRACFAGGAVLAAGVIFGVAIGRPGLSGVRSSGSAVERPSGEPAAIASVPDTTDRPAAVPAPAVISAPMVAQAAPPLARRIAASPSPLARRPRAAALPQVDPYLMLTEDASRPEMGMVVRVRLPLSALTTIGELPPNARTSPETEADVLVGQDGRARAIRFVSQTLTPGRK